MSGFQLTPEQLKQLRILGIDTDNLPSDPKALAQLIADAQERKKEEEQQADQERKTVHYKLSITDYPLQR